MDGPLVVMMTFKVSSEPVCIQDGRHQWTFHQADISKWVYLSQVSDTGSPEPLVLISRGNTRLSVYLTDNSVLQGVQLEKNCVDEQASGFVVGENSTRLRKE